MALSGEYEPSAWDWVRKHTDTIIESGSTAGVDFQGKPVILLTSIGARTGKLRKTPLMRVEHDGCYALVASVGGAPKHPVWYHNVKADPRVDIQDGENVVECIAREVEGDEKALWWRRAVEAYPDYADYQQKPDRSIPVFVLSPVG